MSVRARDRSADNILLSGNEPASPIVPKLNSPMQRSMSFKRPQEFSKLELINRISLQSKPETSHSSTPSISPSSSQEHIYDNLDVFKRSNESIVKVREQPSTRARPVTMHSSIGNEKEMTNEFENVFKQVQRRTSTRAVREDEPTVKSPQPINRRKTTTGVHLTPNNKVATDQTQPTPSWIDIAKQKQSKLYKILMFFFMFLFDFFFLVNQFRMKNPKTNR